MEYDGEDLLAELGVEIPWPVGGVKRAEVKRHTEWSNCHTFEFKGWVAMVTRTTCEFCGHSQDKLTGIFTEEVKTGTGARRLQAVSEWPDGEHRCEVSRARSPFCADCVGALGFSREVEVGGTANDIRIGG